LLLDLIELPIRDIAPLLQPMVVLSKASMGMFVVVMMMLLLDD
jgi:hypothetical protein